MCCCSISKFPFLCKINQLLNDTYKAEALIDSGCDDKSFISEKLCNILKLKIIQSRITIGMTSASLSTLSKGYCTVNLQEGEAPCSRWALHRHYPGD